MRGAWLKVAARWRHSRGFGIHSPFAYDLIVNTLRERRCRYYLYAAIEANHRADSEVLKLVLRLLSRLAPASVSAVGALDEVVTSIARKVDRGVAIGQPGATEMLIITPGEADEQLSAPVAATLESGGTVIITDRARYAASAAAALDRAMTFSNGKVLIAAGRSDLPRQHFDIYF